jgi:glycosyltransferase involved in cell wall biosynthesis
MNLRAPDGSGYKNRRTLLFVGALDYGPNIDGLKWFIEGIFPKVKERYRDMRLLVVGRRPTEDVVVLCREQPGVELHSDVADVGSFYEKCGAAVVPLLSGGGTRIKILEAAMAGRPVFSTPLGMHGLDLGDGVQLSLFTDERSFLEQFQSIDDEKKYRERVANMYDAVNKVYSPAVFEMSMEKVLESILQGTMGGVVSCPADGHTTR